MDFVKFKNLLFKKAKIEGIEECEISFINMEKISVSVYEQKVENYTLNKNFNLSFRGKINNKMGYAFTEIMDEDVIDMLVKKVKESAMFIGSHDVEFIYEGDKEYAKVSSYSPEIENIKVEDMVEIGSAMEREARAYSEKVNNIETCYVSYMKNHYGIYNTKGLELDNNMNYLSMYVVPVIKERSKKYGGLGYLIADSLDEINPRKVARQGVEEALSRIGGRSIPTGKYEAIIGNEAMLLLLSAFSRIFNADLVQNGLSLLKNEDEMVASEIVTLIDDPHLDKGIVVTPFDDEGVATYKKEVISKGKLTTFLYNLKSSYKAGIKSTGNGFKSSFSSGIGVSPTNLYISNGDMSLEDMIKSMDKGVLITGFSGLKSGTNVITGKFSLGAEGFYIDNGKKSYPIDNITVAGNFIEVLKNIKLIADDLMFSMGNTGSPSVYIGEISIGGI